MRALDKTQQAQLQKSAQTVIDTVCEVTEGERVLIITNAHPQTAHIGMALYDAAIAAKAEPSLIFQKQKSLVDFSDQSVIAALKTEPDVCISVSANKLGKDEYALAHPYTSEHGVHNNIFDYNLHGKKNMRAVWTPGITVDIFNRCTCIDYDLLERRCKKIMAVLEGASIVSVTAPSGTDITISIEGRKPMADDGRFNKKGCGGNIPAGEVFISPVVDSALGTIVFDGSIALRDGTVLIKEPIVVKVEDGYITDIRGAKEAELLLETISEGEQRALDFEKEGKLACGDGQRYKKNARNLGELGIGLNPLAGVFGNMLEDEKAFNTCHFAIGSNYDDDANALIHLDGVVKNPTITVFYEDGRSPCVIEKDGVIVLE
ncbi:MAG: aminopeptidase [Bacteroidales bacterium]